MQWWRIIQLLRSKRMRQYETIRRSREQGWNKSHWPKYEDQQSGGKEQSNGQSGDVVSERERWIMKLQVEFWWLKKKKTVEEGRNVWVIMRDKHNGAKRNLDYFLFFVLLYLGVNRYLARTSKKIVIDASDVKLFSFGKRAMMWCNLGKHYRYKRVIDVIHAIAKDVSINISSNNNKLKCLVFNYKSCCIICCVKYCLQIKIITKW